jgi:hypothetical protein
MYGFDCKVNALGPVLLWLANDPQVIWMSVFLSRASTSSANLVLMPKEKRMANKSTIYFIFCTSSFVVIRFCGFMDEHGKTWPDLFI